MSRRPHQPDDTDEEDGLLVRWSKRKTQTQSSDSTLEKVDDAHREPLSQTPDEPVKTDEDMPSLDTISDSSDVSEFFSPGVSETLRKAALRKLFHSPAFNIVDGLDDYDDDFSTFQALGDILTADMRHQMELEEEREKSQDLESMDETLHTEANQTDEGEQDTSSADEDSDETAESEKAAAANPTRGSSMDLGGKGSKEGENTA